MRSLYVTYDGLLDPLGQSQILPYVRRLAAVGHTFTILSFEKHRPQLEIDSLERELRTLGIKWHRLPFVRGRASFPRRLVAGAYWIRKLVREFHPDVVHLRGFVPAMIKILSFCRLPHIYDFRSFAVEEWAECGKISKNSAAYYLFRSIDRAAIKSARGIVVLERPAEDLLRRVYRPTPGVPLQVIRTSTDSSKYPPKPAADRTQPHDGTLGFISLGGGRYPYRPDLALRFVKALNARGIRCTLDFINEGDHEILRDEAATVGFPEKTVNIFAAKHADVPGLLGRYDCGIFFCDTSPWRRVCSPTKLGEYLSAGLPVISLPGIDVIDTYASVSSCVTTIAREEIERGLGEPEARRIASFVITPGIAESCQALARRDFDLQDAGNRYVALYEATSRLLGTKKH